MRRVAIILEYQENYKLSIYICCFIFVMIQRATDKPDYFILLLYQMPSVSSLFVCLLKKKGGGGA